MTGKDAVIAGGLPALVPGARGAHGGHRYIRGLDGLRALAVIAVVFYHVNHLFSGLFPVTWAGSLLAALFSCGWSGVDLFFVLSGFLITGILLDSKRDSRFFRNFYARRVLRIMPLYYGFLVFVIFVLPRLPGCHGLIVTSGESWSLLLYYFNFREAWVATGAPLHVSPFWSLAIEEHFYLVWPLVVWLVPERKLIRVCVVGAVASFLLRVIVVAAGQKLKVPYFISPCRLDGLLAGAFVALARRDAVMGAMVSRRASTVALASGSFLLGMFLGLRHFYPFFELGFDPGLRMDSKFVVTLGLFVLAVFYAALVVVLLDRPRGRMVALLQARPLRAAGTYSYAMYVFHGLIVLASWRFLVDHAPKIAALPGWMGKPALAGWVLLVCFGAAYLSYHLYEKRFLRLKRYFGGK